jgi:hypothetical protein
MYLRVGISIKWPFNVDTLNTTVPSNITNTFLCRTMSLRNFVSFTVLINAFISLIFSMSSREYAECFVLDSVVNICSFVVFEVSHKLAKASLCVWSVSVCFTLWKLSEMRVKCFLWSALRYTEEDGLLRDVRWWGFVVKDDNVKSKWWKGLERLVGGFLRGDIVSYAVSWVGLERKGWGVFGMLGEMCGWLMWVCVEWSLLEWVVG